MSPLGWISKIVATFISCLRSSPEHKDKDGSKITPTRPTNTAPNAAPNDSSAERNASKSKTPQHEVSNDSAKLISSTPPTVFQLPLRVKFCRYEDGKIIKYERLLSDTSYVAMSHVWGRVFWQEIPGVDGEVRVSMEKAKFIKERLPSIVGSEYFWMDILCVDQRNKDARIAVTQHIPKIFRSAKRTVVVRNSEGLRDCCSSVTEHIDTLEKWWKIDRPLISHLSECHLTNSCPDEAVLTRLWPLQEIILSDCIQFVRCDTIVEDLEEQEASLSKTPSWDPSEITWSIFAHLSGMSGAWHGYGTDLTASADEVLKFSLAFINCGNVSRRPRDKSLQFPTSSALKLDLYSSRRTSHPRDFILAIMPQYEFYTVPPNAKKMTFSELYRDCFQQGTSAGFKLAPLIAAPVPHIGRVARTPDIIPDPACLGDLVRLFLGPTQHTKSIECDRSPTIHKVEVQIINTSDVVEAQRIIIESIACTKSSWVNFGITQLSTKLNRFSEISQDLKVDLSSELEIKSAISICSSLYDHQLLDESKGKPLFGTQQSFDDTLLDNPVWMNSAILLAALLPCGLGVSAFRWSKENLTPVWVKFQGRSILALVPNTVVEDIHARSVGKMDNPSDQGSLTSYKKGFRSRFKLPFGKLKEEKANSMTSVNKSKATASEEPSAHTVVEVREEKLMRDYEAILSINDKVAFRATSDDGTLWPMHGI